MAIEIEPIRIEDLDELFPLVERFASSFATDRAAFDRSACQLVGRSDVWLGGARASGALVGYCLGFEHVTFYATARSRGSKRSWSRSRSAGMGSGAR
jgi:hypothetical protein